MQTFELNIFDDQLVNGEELREFLTSHTETVCISTMLEGPSLEHYGVLRILDEHCQQTSRDPNTIIILTPNPLEEYVYPRLSCKNDWWKYCLWSYERTQIVPNNLNHKKFACFIGRKTPERLSILYWLRGKDCLLSSMRDDNYNPKNMRMDTVDGWVDDHADLCQWVYNIDIPPLDNYSVGDQYTVKDPLSEEFGKSHMSLLNFYHNFDVEIAVDTWTQGNTFFPTEKTIRPILAGKPFIIYGAKHWLKNLRDMGFMTWEDCWDQSYDDYSGIERWKRMQVLIEDLSSRDDYLEKALEIAKYNKKHALKIAKKYDS